MSAVCTHNELLGRCPICNRDARIAALEAALRNISTVHPKELFPAVDRPLEEIEAGREAQEEKYRRDEEAFFEVWFQLQRHQDWERKYPNEPFHENWGMGFHDAMLQGWMARAGFHVSYARSGKVKS